MKKFRCGFCIPVRDGVRRLFPPRLPPTTDLFYTGKLPSHACPALIPLSNPNESIVRERIFRSLENVCLQWTP